MTVLVLDAVLQRERPGLATVGHLARVGGDVADDGETALGVFLVRGQTAEISFESRPASLT